MSTQANNGGEHLLELIVDTLQQLDPATQGVFLQKFLRNLASVDVSEIESLTHWQEILRRRKDLTDRLGRPVTLKTAAVDYFGTTFLLHNPVLLEYSELKRLRHNATTDPLTGLYNRRLFNEYLAKELNRSTRHSFPLAMVLFDLRNFKQVNDTYGHAVGDSILQGLARVCVETIRGSDYPCRIGGDEFAVLLPQTESPSAHTLTRRIMEKFEQEVRQLARDVDLGLDCGVASFPEDGETSTDLFEAADRRLYAGKKTARVAGVEPHLESESPQPAAEPPPASYPSAPAGTPGQYQQRRDKRVSLDGTGAYVVLSDGFGTRQAQVLDLSSRGVGFLVDGTTELPERFQARFHLPILVELPRLPAHQLRVRRVYERRMPEGQMRVGCSFNA